MYLQLQRDASHDGPPGLGMKKSTKRGQRKGRPYTPKPKQARVLARHFAGQSDRRISREEHISRGTVVRIRSQAEVGMLLQSYRKAPTCILVARGVTVVSEIPFEDGQIVCRDGVDVKTLEVMSYAASFPDSLIGDARNPGTLNHQLQTSQ
jgi:hypothetical protein